MLAEVVSKDKIQRLRVIVAKLKQANCLEEAKELNLDVFGVKTSFHHDFNYHKVVHSCKDFTDSEELTWLVRSFHMLFGHEENKKKDVREAINPMFVSLRVKAEPHITGKDLDQMIAALTFTRAVLRKLEHDFTMPPKTGESGDDMAMREEYNAFLKVPPPEF